MYSITEEQIFGTPKGDTIMFHDDLGHLRSAKRSEVRIITKKEKQKSEELMAQICQHWLEKKLTMSEFFTLIKD